MVYMPTVPSGSWSQCVPFVWDPVKVSDIRFSSSHFRKQHPRHEKAVSRTSLTAAVYTWPCESISRGRAGPLHSRLYQGIDQRLVHTPFVPAGYWSPCAALVNDPVKAPEILFSSSGFCKQHPRHEKAID
ncbi:unnamed protein product [Schistosoma mattheei]|uniref:Uncharacterized protein n=1 Tax=Schistosoma mattheei TaxID=31246 RepID=A0A3P8EPD6_9TREM|nr:unnamed protein product [Schistosoma mattheei]